MPDVNLLVYAHRADEKTHAAHRRWLEDVINGPRPFALSVLVAVGFIRIVTNPRIYTTPTPPQVAIAAIEEIRAQPQCRVVVPGPNHLERVLELCRLVSAAG
ncbi:MAG: TA system VapC family ribonuclease toxin [Candidatus Binataceae bacterium]